MGISLTFYTGLNKINFRARNRATCPLRKDLTVELKFQSAGIDLTWHGRMYMCECEVRDNYDSGVGRPGHLVLQCNFIYQKRM